MIKVEGHKVTYSYFPDGTLNLNNSVDITWKPINHICDIVWLYDSNEELFALYCINRHLQEKGYRTALSMPYIPNARQDRTKSSSDIHNLKYFAELINLMNFKSVTVLDPHSSVSEALLNNLRVADISFNIDDVFVNISDRDNLSLFYPDEGAMKRYSQSMYQDLQFSYGMKDRDWKTGEIKSLNIQGDIKKGAPILIIDDICSYGGTFYHAAKKLKELGAGDLYLYISHCENSILDGDLIKSGLIKKIFTTDSIFTKEHGDIELVETYRGRN